MAVYKEELNNDFKYPYIHIYNQYKDGVQYAYKVIPYEGYVMFDINDDFYIQDSPDSVPVKVKRPITIAGLPLNYDFGSFPFVAERRSLIG